MQISRGKKILSTFFKPHPGKSKLAQFTFKATTFDVRGNEMKSANFSNSDNQLDCKIRRLFRHFLDLNVAVFVPFRFIQTSLFFQKDETFREFTGNGSKKVAKFGKN